jgi:GNAT superfamily N-acetyltransferase
LEQPVALRLATDNDVPSLHALIEASVRSLQAGDYTPAQIEGALGTVLGLDTQLIRDNTYFVAETAEATPDNRIRIVACGGWSKRKTLFGADRGPGREPELLDPATDAAKVRAIFVHPEFARRGLGSLILAHVEAGDNSGLFAIRNGINADRRAALPAERLRGNGAHRRPARERRSVDRSEDGEIQAFLNEAGDPGVWSAVDHL